ncbi:hypothetical protein JN11_04827 [Mucilaginibacter frigoritolerans]|uniref:POTRA domain-containing protein n=1 Tax=Mucilaginibacter frigoritolerans TaxID=652788 RepID=A0A562TKZ3_9SPHI|nr:hypothetical protein [Mucilaginibacter frigoritolerans]TWI94221.1 hypothetical protein JN11_04827 [Mucilaginibacter frigoritolerans]
MKKTILLLVILIILLVGFASAQNKIDKYCQVVVFAKARISIGDIKQLFALKDTSEYEKLKLVNRLKNTIDVLNYMSKLGWTVVNIHANGVANSVEVLYFKKQYDTTELQED